MNQTDIRPRLILETRLDSLKDILKEMQEIACTLYSNVKKDFIVVANFNGVILMVDRKTDLLDTYDTHTQNNPINGDTIDHTSKIIRAHVKT